MQQPPDSPQGALEQRLFEIATDALVVAASDGTIRLANPAAGRLMGRGAAELSGGSLWDAVHPDDLEHARGLLAAPTAGESVPDEELRFRVVRPDGESRWVEARAVADPRSGLWHLVARDVTQRSEADSERLAQAFHDSPMGMAFIDPDGTLRRVNPALCRLLVRSERELIGAQALDLASSRDAAERWASRHWADGAPESLELEARLSTGDGRPVVALVSATLVRDQAGEPLYYLSQFQDVTERIAAQEALAANEAKLAEAQQVARLGSWEWLVEDDRVSWSDELYRIYGLRPDPGAARAYADHLERVHEDDRGRVARAVERAVAELSPWSIDYRIVRPDGDVRMVHARGEVAAGDSGRVIVHGTCQDVTESRRVEDALRAAEQLFRRAFDDAPIGMALLDLEGGWLRMNPALAQMVGYSEAQLRAMTLEGLAHPEDVGLDRPLVRELLAGRRRSYAVEKRLVHSDGRIIHVLAHVSLMHGDGERPLYFLVQLVDLSERRRAEAERRAGEQRLQAIVDNAPALISVKDAQRRFVLVNRRWEVVMGVAADVALGRTAAEILPRALADTERDDLDEEVVETATPRETQVLVVSGDGDGDREFLTVKFPLFDTDGRISGVCSISTDLTERHRAERERAELEQRLAQAQRLESVGQLAGGVAHDFNNLLSVILSCVGFAEHQLDESSPVRAEVEEIGRAAECAAALTRQLLMFSRREVVQPEVLDLGALVGGLESLLSRSLGEQVTLRIARDGHLPAVLADRSRLEQVLVNLAVNARDAMPEGGILAIEVRAVAGGVTVSVTDEGVGMAPNVVDRAFEPFFTTKAPGEGTGLGLATVHGIVTDSGGEVEIDSRPGAGTTVRFTLPAAGEGEPVARLDQGERPAMPRLPCARVLVVEDQDPVRRQAVRILEAQGYEVLQSGSAADALERWQPVDLLLTDVVMPGMSGHELARRAIERSPELRVVFMSGHTEDALVRDGARERQLALVQKPFTRDSLLAAVAGALVAGPVGD
ncbi:MAG: PAS domain S-box protein [Solirubrobacteraceae bacterium]|nr:PAS domain S-box protein [Solirubrobacteraceae bacterium]